MAICNEWIKSLPEENGDFQNLQKLAREFLLRNGLPNKSEEDWRGTDLIKLENLFKLDLLKPSENRNNHSKKVFKSQSKESIRIALDQGIDSLKQIELPRGMSIISLEEIKENALGLFSNFSKIRNYLKAINESINTNIFALKVSGKNLPSVELLLPSKANSLIPTRVLIILEKGASLNLIEIANGEENSANCHLTEIKLEENSNLNHDFICLGNGKGKFLSELLVAQDAGSSYKLTAIQHGAEFSRLEPKIIQNNGSAHTTIRGLQVSEGTQELGTHSTVIFNGPDGKLDQLHKAVANNYSHSIFNGSIKVPKIAQKTNAEQLSRNLLLSNHARIDTKPELEIIADDVKCSHGATVCQLEENELFYLRSRGISSDQATFVLLKGFCQEVVNTLHSESIQLEILKRILSS